MTDGDNPSALNHSTYKTTFRDVPPKGKTLIRGNEFVFVRAVGAAQLVDCPEKACQPFRLRVIAFLGKDDHRLRDVSMSFVIKLCL